MTGDVALGNHPKTPGFGFYSRYKRGFPINKCKRIFPQNIKADLVFGNLEFVLANIDNHPGSDACCIGALSSVDFLHQCGFTVLNIANNHALDYGKDIFQTTVKAIQAHDIKVIGITEDFDADRFIKIKGKTIAFIGFLAHPQQIKSSGYGLNLFQKKQVLQLIKTARCFADIVCVSIHWGDEFVPIPSPSERKTSHEMIDAGASIIVGHHPHVLREVEKYKNGIIAYSLGNFISDMTWNPMTRETGCLLVELDGDVVNNHRFFPATIGLDYFPKFLSKNDYVSFLERQERRRLKWKRELKHNNYDSLSRKALRKNALFTLPFFLKNLFNYSPGTIKRIIAHGISTRLAAIGGD